MLMPFFYVHTYTCCIQIICIHELQPTYIHLLTYIDLYIIMCNPHAKK